MKTKDKIVNDEMMNNIVLRSKENKDNKEIMELGKYQNKEGKNEMSMKRASNPIFVET